MWESRSLSFVCYHVVRDGKRGISAAGSVSSDAFPVAGTYEHGLRLLPATSALDSLQPSFSPITEAASIASTMKSTVAEDAFKQDGWHSHLPHLSRCLHYYLVNTLVDSESSSAELPHFLKEAKTLHLVSFVKRSKYFAQCFHFHPFPGLKIQVICFRSES